MPYRVLTISHEFGSGGIYVARRSAEQLGWKLLDSELIETLVERVNVDPGVARRYDENLDPWLDRLSRKAVLPGGSHPPGTLDPAELAELTRNIQLEAAEMGGCVIVGRGAQCLLAGRADTFHVFIHGPRAVRLQFLRDRLGERENLDQAMDTVDHERADYVRLHHGRDVYDRNLYDLKVNCRLGIDFAVRLILTALGHGE